jgi:hypothetical protein
MWSSLPRRWWSSKKNLPQRLATLHALYGADSALAGPVRYWCADESRFGLNSIPRRRLTATGVKPIGPLQWRFHAYYLYGAVEPASGEYFLLEFSHSDSVCFQRFLEHFAAQYPDQFHILQLDQASFHLTPSLRLPDNIILLCQPPKSPETNPIERLWQYLKEPLSWAVFYTLDELRAVVDPLIRALTPAVVASLTGFGFILNALKFANFY